ncbi:MAG: 5-deoxy-glucuronate isomerase, partial [Chloroflexia bacterium]|nr:5-deoxy-glucuronate isomerase [Chloroflexia bacterium]
MRNPDELLLHSSALTYPSTGVEVGPKEAGWTYVSLRTIRIAAGKTFSYATGRDEICLVPLQGSATVDCSGERWEISRPGTVFDGKPTAL